MDQIINRLIREATPRALLDSKVTSVCVEIFAFKLAEVFKEIPVGEGFDMSYELNDGCVVSVHKAIKFKDLQSREPMFRSFIKDFLQSANNKINEVFSKSVFPESETETETHTSMLYYQFRLHIHQGSALLNEPKGEICTSQFYSMYPSIPSTIRETVEQIISTIKEKSK